MEVTGAAGTIGVSAARHVTPVGSVASGCVRAPELRAIPAMARERKSGPVTRRNAQVSHSGDDVRVSWEKGERVEKTESVLFFKCIIHAWKDCINTFCLGRFFFLLCGCISLHASPRGSLTETKECVVSVCATDLHMHSVCQADWKWFPVVRTTAKGLYCDFRTAPVSSLSVSGPPVNSHTHPSSPPHWFFHIPASRCLFILHLPERYSMWRSSLALFLSR